MLKVVKKDKLILFTYLVHLKATAMLDYFKTILFKVSFDLNIFEKELKKALRSLVENEIEELKQWCYANFGETHELVLGKCFV
jgi:hypothetical protein